MFEAKTPQFAARPFIEFLISDFGTHGNLVHPSGLICNYCSYSRDFPSNFLSHGLLPPRSCFVPAPRALPLAGQTFHVWLISLTAVGCCVLQVWDSASSRLLADFHRSAPIASVVQKKRKKCRTISCVPFKRGGGQTKLRLSSDQAALLRL